MLTDVLFPAELQLHVDGIEMEKNTVNISVASTNGRSICPHCQTISERVHSSYSRHPADRRLLAILFVCQWPCIDSFVTIVTAKPRPSQREFL